MTGVGLLIELIAILIYLIFGVQSSLLIGAAICLIGTQLALSSIREAVQEVTSTIPLLDLRIARLEGLT